MVCLVADPRFADDGKAASVESTEQNRLSDPDPLWDFDLVCPTSNNNQRENANNVTGYSDYEESHIRE